MSRERKRTRLFGGGHLYLKDKAVGGTWVDMGELALDAVLNDDTAQVEVVLNDGDSFEIDGRRKVNANFVLNQTGKEELDFIADDSRGKTYEMYYGHPVVGGKWQEFYAKEIKVNNAMELDSKGSPVTLKLGLSIFPQAAVFSVAPGDLPTIKKMTAANQTSKNKYYQWIETTVA